MDFLEYVRMCQEEPDQERRQEKLCRGLIYKVEAGDTLYSISRRYGLKVRDLMRANPFVNVYQLQIGEEICIPLVVNGQTEGVRPYVVKRGDTVLSILERTGVSFEDLAGWNKSVASLRLPVGTILLVPVRRQEQEQRERTDNTNQMEKEIPSSFPPETGKTEMKSKMDENFS